MLNQGLLIKLENYYQLDMVLTSLIEFNPMNYLLYNHHQFNLMGCLFLIILMELLLMGYIIIQVQNLNI